MDSEQLIGFTNALTGRLTRRTALHRSGSLLAATLLTVAGAPAAAAQATPAATDPTAVVQAYLRAMNAHDLAATLALYADDAVHIIFPPPSGATGVYIGKTQIRTFYEPPMAPAAALTAEAVGPIAVAGNTATYVKRIAQAPWRQLGIPYLDHHIYAEVAGGRFTLYVAMMFPAGVAQLFRALKVIPAAGTPAA